MTTMNTATICPMLFSNKNPQILLKYALIILTSSIRSTSISLATILVSIDHMNSEEVTYTR